MNHEPNRFVVIGDQSLTIACAAELLSRSHVIVGLVSDAAPVIDWAAEHGVTVVSRGELNGLEQVDYLLSVANLKLLTADELAIPKKGAINFHDGPLPEIAGVNNPSWAIHGQVSEYGVTWHEMVSDVDRGDILAAERFELEADETSVSLNTRCFHAGFRSFQALLARIETGTLDRTAQPKDRERQYHSKWKRPKAACSLFWGAGAEKVDALVRCLDFGTYENNLGIAKVELPTGLIAVGKVSVLPDRSTQAPGTVVEAANNWARIATSTNDIRISKLSGLASGPIPLSEDRVRLVADCGLKAGQVLPEFTDEDAADLDALVMRSARSEHAWVERLEQLSLLELPQTEDDAELSETLELPTALRDPSSALAAVAAYLGRSFRSDEIGLWVHQRPREHGRFDGYFLSGTPLDVRVNWDATVHELSATLQPELEATLTRAPILADIGLRYPSLSDKLQQIATLPSCEFSLGGDGHLREPRSGARRLLFTMSENNDSITLTANGIFEPEAFARFVDRFQVMVESLVRDPAPAIAACPVLTDADLALLSSVNKLQETTSAQTVHDMFHVQAQATPDRIAVTAGDRQLTYQELEQSSDRLANALLANGVTPGDLVGVMMGRGVELMTVLLGVIKAGAAYVPLDRDYPPDRLQFVIGDCRPKLIIVDHAPAWSVDTVQMIQCSTLLEKPKSQGFVPASGSPSDLMYVIYTSGSTGKPKGVQVRHENVHNFFIGIDERIGTDAGILLATTSISFDISVLELFWTLCRGFTVVLHDDAAAASRTQLPDQPIGFSLFFWNVAETAPVDGSPYNLVLRASQYADKHEFEAVWTPERHFGSFGGYYPNPSVISAAIAATTNRVAIRAGSCVLPLHHPVRVAEEWSVVDNLSGGRVGISMAAGWNPNDFVLKPDGFANAKDLMFEGIEQVRSLWRGEAVTFEGAKGPQDVKSLPRPVQEELPIWVTAAGNPETFRKAGEIGANILTHLLGQTLETVSKNIEIYREAWRTSGKPGNGHVTVMLHTLVAATEREAKSISREPMKNYLRSALALIRDAAWEFPTFQKFSSEGERTIDDFFANADPQDVDDLLEFAFERYYNANSLLGSVDKCVEFADALKKIGVDEIGCLVDFGIDDSTVLAHLPLLNEVRSASNADGEDTLSVSQSIVQNGITHLQCTPSRASMMLYEPDAGSALANLTCLMVGGEPLSGELVQGLQEHASAPIFNMYGPTETTIWSTVCTINEPDDAKSIGTPLANQAVHVLDPRGVPVPPDVVGELAVGGLGVTSGYLGRPELNKERFVEVADVNGRSTAVYKTGDLVRLEQDGRLEFLGRGDEQVKVRGYRIELGEIETCMRQCPGVDAAAVVVQGGNTPEAIIVGFYVSPDGTSLTDKLSTEMRTHLPVFMVPAHLVCVPELPYQPNGKLDRRRLEQMEVVRQARSDAVPPSTETECALADIWSSLLNVEAISVTDNFFELGGHSLLAIQAIDAIEKQVGVRLNPRKVLTNTLEQLAKDCVAMPAAPEQKSRSSTFGRFFGRGN